ncbi:type II toxin-antitoxin system YoeB family toxin [Streptomyces sp. NPDC001165]|uniref:type II toxin-antitoxin system YoeB family toxin n=1 Tax=Streptomyces sp. NPDC001165 TaxID=3364546 RepID=UPI00368F3643
MTSEERPLRPGRLGGLPVPARPGPEPLKGDLTGYWSRRIDDERRLVYRADDKEVKIRQLLPCMRDRDGGPSAIATPRPAAELTAERDRMIADLVLPHSRLRSSGEPPSGDPRRGDPGGRRRVTGRTPERPTHQEGSPRPVRPWRYASRIRRSSRPT